MKRITVLLPRTATFLLVFWLASIVVAASPALGGFAEGKAAYSSKDYETAYLEFREAADGGHTEAQYHLGMMYRRGQGVRTAPVKAVSWYRKAAEQGHVRAQFWLGWMYRRGRGVEQDYAEAARWYGKAAEQGHAMGQHNLGMLYREGKGVPQNRVEAYKWFSLHVTQKPNSQHAWVLGDMEEYMTQMEVAEAKERAKNWRPASGN